MRKEINSKMEPIILKCDESDIEFIGKGLLSYNKSKVSFIQEVPFLKMNYKIEKSGKIIAGIKSVLYCWNCLFIDLLFVDKKFRNKGYGKLLLQRVENEARKYDCHLIHLDTFDFQAKGFYKKNGFEVFGKLHDCPKGHTRYYMKKIVIKEKIENSTGEKTRANE